MSLWLQFNWHQFNLKELNKEYLLNKRKKKLKRIINAE